jgi:hypothetical protein
MTLGFGSNVTFTFNPSAPLLEQISVTFTQDDYEFDLNRDGDGYLPFLGMDRVERDISLPFPEDLALGGVRLRGPVYPVRYQYSFRLRLLTRAKFDLFQNMVQAQLATKKLMRLDDRVLQVSDYGAKLRATASGAAAPVVAGGFTTYYPALLVWVPRISVRSFDGVDQGKLEFEAIEFGEPLAP